MRQNLKRWFGDRESSRSHGYQREVVYNVTAEKNEDRKQC